MAVPNRGRKNQKFGRLWRNFRVRAATLVAGCGIWIWAQDVLRAATLQLCWRCGAVHGSSSSGGEDGERCIAASAGVASSSLGLSRVIGGSC